jgi:hypothetical protein
MDKENVVYIHNEVTFGHKKECVGKWISQTQKDKHCIFSLNVDLYKTDRKVERGLLEMRMVTRGGG